MNINAGSSLKMEHGIVFNSGTPELVIDWEVIRRSY